MDPFTAIGLVSAIVQFVDFGIKLVSKAHEIYESADGVLEENIEIEAISHSLQNVTVKLNIPTQPQGSGSTALTQVDRDIIDLANKSKAVADELSKVMGKLQVSKKSKMKSLGMAVKSVWKKSEIVDLEGRLVKIRDELSFDVTISIRYAVNLAHLGLYSPKALKSLGFKDFRAFLASNVVVFRGHNSIISSKALNIGSFPNKSLQT
jgi:hypothetical protein